MFLALALVLVLVSHFSFLGSWFLVLGSGWTGSFVVPAVCVVCGGVRDTVLQALVLALALALGVWGEEDGVG